jgi:hypothetical protein
LTTRSAGALFPHEVSDSAEGVACRTCGEPATHKVGEESAPDYRHNWTAYLCCLCFGNVMGPVVQRWCAQATTHRSVCWKKSSFGEDFCGAHPGEEWPCRHLGA